MKTIKTIWDKIKFIFSIIFDRKGCGISILVPFYSPDLENQRAKNWKWLKQYWAKQLPGAEIIIGIDSEAGKDNKSFSKSCAVNDAVSKANGDIYVIADADGYIDVNSILYCAKEIRLARKNKKKLWFIPYRKFYRLTESASQELLNSDAKNPLKYTDQPSKNQVLESGHFNGVSGSAVGHWYGALMQVMPEEAFKAVGGWDPRFRGWGGEDHAAMRAMDTLYWPHKTLPTPVFHVWHPILSAAKPNSPKNKNRLWENQDVNNSNDTLSHRYYWAQGNVERMQKLVNEWKNTNKK